MRTYAFLAVAFLGGVLGGTSAFAVPVTYIETATASGSLGPNAFTGSPITFTGVGDTANVQQVGGVAVYVNVLPITFSLAGIFTTTFTDTVEFVANQGVADMGQDEAGVSDVTNGSGLLFDANPAFANYALVTSIGPIVGTPSPVVPLGFSTGLGALELSLVSSVEFQSVLGAASVTPEPTSFALLGTGLLGVVAAARRRVFT